MELNLARDVAAPVWLCWVNPPVSCAVNPVAKKEDSSSNNRQNLVCSRDPSLCEPPGDVDGSGTQCHCTHNLSWTGAHSLLLSGWPTSNSESGPVTKRSVGFVGLTNEPAQSNIQKMLTAADTRVVTNTPQFLNISAYANDWWHYHGPVHMLCDYLLRRRYAKKKQRPPGIISRFMRYLSRLSRRECKNTLPVAAAAGAKAWVDTVFNPTGNLCFYYFHILDWRVETGAGARGAGTMYIWLGPLIRCS